MGHKKVERATTSGPGATHCVYISRSFMHCGQAFVFGLVICRAQRKISYTLFLQWETTADAVLPGCLERNQ